MDDTQNSVQLEPKPIDINFLNEVMYEIENQPHWRTIANKEADYADGKQLDSDILKRMQALGIPPAIEDIISPTLMAVEGYEIANRTDWRVTANDTLSGSDDVAEALNQRLNEAERNSKADHACTKAFRGQITVGIGWVEVTRNPNPFKYPYRCLPIPRSEMYWDMQSRENDLSDARWLCRKRWVDPKSLIGLFPEHDGKIKDIASGMYSPRYTYSQFDDELSDTNLLNTWGSTPPWTYEQQNWYDPTSKKVQMVELWYRQWVRVPVLRFNNNRVVEFDMLNPSHSVAISSGRAVKIEATVPRLRRSYWLGDILLHDDATPYPHENFPYVPFWGFREDSTGIPYGFVRRMKYNQDAVNSGISKMRWGMSVVRVERTKGAVAMSDAQLRDQIARHDADIVLDANHMAQQGSRFQVFRDYQLSNQHMQLVNDNRAAIERVSGITTSFRGTSGNATSGTQEQVQVDQSNQSLTSMMQNFKDARTQIGEILLAMIIQDIGSEPQDVLVEGDALHDSRLVTLNKPESDDLGYSYLSNDVQRTRLRVALEDVPSTNSFRQQQLNAMSEVVKSLPDNVQIALTPFLTNLMDIPDKKEVIAAIRDATQTQDPEQMRKEIEEQVKRDLQYELKQTELELRKMEIEAKIDLIKSQAIQTNVGAAYSAMQAGVQVAQVPQIAPIADAIMQGAGYERPNPMGDDPNFPTPNEVAAMNMRSPYIQGEGSQVGSEQIPEVMDVPQNTSPAYPPVPQDAPSPQQGIETPSFNDNI